MKILFITDNFYPETNAPAKRTLDHCKEWINLGHSATIITGAPNFPMGKVFEGYKNRLYHFEIISKIKVKRVWTFIAPNKGFFFRIIDYMSFMFSSILCGLFTKKHDVVIATSPQFFTLISGYLISLFKQTPFVIEIRDLWPESISSVGAMKESSAVFKILLKISNFLYKKANVIICVTKSFKNDLVNRGIDKNKIFVIENGFNLNQNLSTNKSINQIENEYGINKDDFIVAFTGTIGMAHGLEIVLKTAAQLNEAVKFLIIGEGAKKHSLIKIKDELNIGNVHFISNISWNEIVNLNQVIDMHLVHLIKTPEFKKVIPSKIFEAMALQKPIILGVLGESKEIIIDAQCGFSITPENDNELKQIILDCIDGKHSLEELGDNGFNYLIKNYSREILATRMINSIKSII